MFCIALKVKQIFTPAPFVSFRSGFSPRNRLVRVKVYPLLREKRSSCCGKSRCETCFNIKGRNTFQSFVIKMVYKINHHFHCHFHVLFTFFLVRYVAYSMLGQLSIDSVWDGITINAPKGCIRRWYSQAELLPPTFLKWRPSRITWKLQNNADW